MATGVINLDSPALSGMTTYTIILPDPAVAGPGPYPVLLQLHGMHDDHRAWIEKSRIWVYVERLPLIVVMPSGGNFWWSNLHLGPGSGGAGPEFNLRYEDYLVHDLREHVQSTFPARKDAKWAIGGLSMGGYGAIRLGLKHPDRFCSIYGHSSAIPNQEEILQRIPTSDRDALADMDCYHWAKQRTPADLPRLSFDCGTDDFLLKQNRRFHAHLEQLSLPHTYKEYPGGHTWDYWDTHIGEALAQHCDVLGIAPKATTPPPGTEE
jgi:putative tributyrin esterase